MLDKVKGGLIVSCKALENEPLHLSLIPIYRDLALVLRLFDLGQRMRVRGGAHTLSLIHI